MLSLRIVLKESLPYMCVYVYAHSQNIETWFLCEGLGNKFFLSNSLIRMTLNINYVQVDTYKVPKKLKSSTRVFLLMHP